MCVGEYPLSGECEHFCVGASACVCVVNVSANLTKCYQE